VPGRSPRAWRSSIRPNAAALPRAHKQFAERWTRRWRAGSAKRRRSRVRRSWCSTRASRTSKRGSG
jgi:hypothetical protein